MEKEKQRHKEIFANVMGVIPVAIASEIERICEKNGKTEVSINEIRLRSLGLSSIVVDGVSLALGARVSPEMLHAIFKQVCDMAVFAHRDDIANGFVSMAGGCRVGVCGHAKYDGGRLVGVNSVSSLVFRIPSGRCDFADQLFEYWKNQDFQGMLICSSAGVGKTSAIRALIARASGKRWLKRLVAVDERCELDPYSYSECTVDILRGYKRAAGIEIAIRTMSAEVLVVDEIGNEADSEALMLAVGAGVPVVATAHGDNIDRVISKPCISKLCNNGLFRSYAVITREGAERRVLLGNLE